MATISSTGTKAYSTKGSGMTAWLLLECVYTDYADRVVHNTTLKLVSTGGISDSNNSYVFNGTTYTGPSISIPYGGGSVTLRSTGNITTYKNWGLENKKYATTTGSISGIDIYPNIGSVTLTLTIPGRAVVTPAAPTNVYIDGDTSNSTTKVVRWTNNPTTEAPYTNVFVSTSPALPGYPKTLSGSTNSLTDTGLPVDAKVRYVIWAANGTNKSNTTLSSTWTATKPKAPTNLAPFRTSATDIRITWAAASSTYTEDRVWVEVDGGAATQIGTVTAVAAGSPSTFTHTGTSVTSTYSYWVEPVTIIGSLEWHGTMTFAGQIGPATPPSPPEILNPIGVLNLEEDRLFAWRHRPTDGSLQSRYEFQWKETSSSTWLPVSPAVVYTNTQSYLFVNNSFVAGNDYDWRVRTWGFHADPSDWANASFAAKVPPSILNITAAPHDDLDATIVTGAQPVISWDFYDPDGDTYSTSLQTKLYEEIGVNTWNGVSTVAGTSADSVKFPYTVKNGKTYLVIIRASNSFGLIGDSSFQFTVNYGPPASATVVVSFDEEQGAVVLDITNPAGDPEPLKNIVSRIQDGVETLLDSNVGINTSFVDQEAPLGITIQYKITTISTLGTASSVTVNSYQTNTKNLSWISAGPLYMSFCADPNVSITYEREKVLHTFAGRTKPIEFVGTMRSRKISVKGGFNVDSPSSNPTRLERIIDSGETVLYRDCFGHVYRCSIDNLSYSQSYLLIGEFSLDMTEVDYLD